MRLSVIIPVYNEEKRLGKTLSSINDYLSKQIYDSEILVVDNGSTDGTAGVVRMLDGKIKGLKLVQGSSAEGKGFAVKKGMLEALGDYRIFTDADNSTSIDQIEKMWPEFEKGFDVVIGSRDIKGAVL
ncbi:MAG: glycosyltransferase, partial [Candidatus Nealsonbacteria bacterium]|nr:glycosyltransferase [Candidatus Nealsonbacteria bacterium]